MKEYHPMSQISYRIITTIKNTEKSRVLLALMEGQEDPVIIKRMKTANPEVYLILSGIDSIHIPRIYAWEWQDNELVVAEEYVDGETLEYYLEKGLLSEEQKLEVALQLCEAAAVLHACMPPIIHRDIKPSNILITEEGILKLIDFDTSRQYKKLSDNSDTRILGTADYAAPEQFGYKQTDVRSDIYSMGIVFDMLDVCVKGPAGLAWKRMQDICTNFDPKKRYKSVNALEKTIHRIIRWYKYQWYVVCIGCTALLFTVGAVCFNRYVENAQEQAGGQILSITPEATLPPTPTIAPSPAPTATNTPAPTATSTPAPTATNTPIPTATSTPELTATSTPEPTTSLSIMWGSDVTEEQLDEIRKVLEAEHADPMEYYQGEPGGDLFIYAGSFEYATNVSKATLVDLARGTTHSLTGEDYRFENACFIINEEYMHTLKNSYYELRLRVCDDENVISSDHTVNVGVYPEGTAFTERWYSLQTNMMEYYYEKHDTMHNALHPNTTVRITGLYLGRFVQVPPEQYTILYDGKGIELSAGLLEQCKYQQETVFEVEYDDGRRDRVTVLNPYLQ